MRPLGASAFLKDNKWVSHAEISNAAVEGSSPRIRIDISPRGHKLIRDHGLREFELQVQSRLSSLGAEPDGWEFLPVREDVWGQFGTAVTGKFPRVLSRINDGSGERVLLDISTDMDLFEGHFPGDPVLAGVVQLHWAVCAARTLFRIDEVPVEIKRLKFKGIVCPPSILELALSRLGENEVQFHYTSLGQVNSEGRLKFGGQ